MHHTTSRVLGAKDIIAKYLVFYSQTRSDRAQQFDMVVYACIYREREREGEGREKGEKCTGRDGSPADSRCRSLAGTSYDSPAEHRTDFRHSFCTRYFTDFTQLLVG